MTFWKAAFAVMLSLFFYPTAQAGLPASSQDTYHSIVGRNVFHLTPVPPPPPAPAPPLPELTLTGITTILPEKRALLKIRYPAAPGKPAEEQACILRPGEREGPVEVLEIDERNGSVTVNNSGTIMTITFAPHRPDHQTAAAARPTRHPPFRLAVH